MKISKFYTEIKDSKIEKEVEMVYKKGLELYFPNSKIEHPHGCDTYLEANIAYDKNTRVLRLIAEFKFEENFNNKTEIAKTLIQVLYYLKRFENAGEILPNVILIGDIDEAFVLHVNSILKYLDEDLDWEIAPSEAYKKNPELILKISNDININPFIFIIDKSFSFLDVANKIKDLTLNIQRYVRVTEHNISKIFDYFIDKVIKDYKKMTANELVSIFINLMIHPDENYIHPNKRNMLVMSNGSCININGDAYESFFGYFERQYKPSEKEKFTAIADRLIEDVNRRFKGEFYTPTIWVDKGHEIISESLGENWKNEYTVWDCSWGTGNLTRDYSFFNLYCSTLNNGDLNIGKKYNRNSIKFQYDFLNDDIDALESGNLKNSKLPKTLIEAFEHDEKILFLINPPYATSKNGSNKEGDSKEGVSNTAINRLMGEDGFGQCRQNLYAQFLYRIWKMKRIYNLTNLVIAVYCPTLYLSGESYKDFRGKFLKDFEYCKGIMFNAGNFSDTAKNKWSISFNVWKSGATENHSSFSHDICEIDNSGNIYEVEEKLVYNLDYDKPANKWAREKTKGLKTYDAPQLSNGINVKPDGRGKLTEDAIGFMQSNSNNINQNTQYVSMFSSAFSGSNGFSITKENIFDSCALFAARRIVKNTWYNTFDEYMQPNTEDELYREFTNDALIYSLFESKSNQSSLRHVVYKDKVWNITNDFFFMSNSKMKELSDMYNNDEIYQDTKDFHNERYVYYILQNIELSNEAQNVLDKAIELVEKSFKYRIIFNNENPEYQVNTWDAGWYQLKNLIQEYMIDDYNDFLVLYKALEEKMKPMIYEVGFLKK